MANPYASYALPTPQAPLALPDINIGVESLRFASGAIIRACLHATVYYGGRGLFEEKVLKKDGALDSRTDAAVRYLCSSGAEFAVSLLWTPTKYLAAATTPRFLLDYMMTSWSDWLSVFDGFRPGRFASYAVSAFMANASDEDWNLDFFVWQVPSIVLTVTKLITRRRRLGAAKCRTKRVLAMLFLQMLLRASVTTFSVMIPETGGQVVEALGITVCEMMTSSYLMRHTWPFPVTQETQDKSAPDAAPRPQAPNVNFESVPRVRHPSPVPGARPTTTASVPPRAAPQTSDPNKLD